MHACSHTLTVFGVLCVLSQFRFCVVLWPEFLKTSMNLMNVSSFLCSKNKYSTAQYM